MYIVKHCIYCTIFPLLKNMHFGNEFHIFFFHKVSTAYVKGGTFNMPCVSIE